LPRNCFRVGRNIEHFFLDGKARSVTLFLDIWTDKCIRI